MEFDKVVEISQPISIRKGITIYKYYTECPNNKKIVSMISEPFNSFPSVPYRIKILDSIPEGKKAEGSFSDLASKLFDSFGEDYIEKQIQELIDVNSHLLEVYHKRADLETSNL